MLTVHRLRGLVDRVGEVADRLGLPVHPVHWELVSPTDLHALAAYGGMPVRYAHWSFGKEWGRLKTAYDYRKSLIYEMVINHRPAYAYLLEELSPARAMVVIAHVLAHVHFFRQNRLFAAVPDDAISQMARHRREMEAARRKKGTDAVESLVDAAQPLTEFTAESPHERRLGEHPSDLLGFLVRHAPRLEDWERRCLYAIWWEARYFWPQVLSKIANEGYATFWHRQIAAELAQGGEEAWEMAKMNAELLAVTPPQLNPYRLGEALVRAAWNAGGAEQLDEVACFADDLSLVRAWLSPAVASRAGLTLVPLREVAAAGGAAPSFFELKAALLQELEHAGIPRLAVDRERTHPQGALELVHHHDGRDLDFDALPHVLGAVAQRIWKGPVVLATVRQKVPRRLVHDTQSFQDQPTGLSAY